MGSSITDWIMVWITAIYVVATIAIFRANKKSAKAAEKQIEQTKKQLEESEWQFMESQRLSCIPFLQLELEDKTHNGSFEIVLFPDCFNPKTGSYEVSGGDSFYFWLKNIGNGSATNLIYTWTYLDGDSNTDMMPINGLMNRDSFPVAFYVDSQKRIEGVLEWGFSDMIGNDYTQKVNLCFENGKVTKLENDIPK